MLLSKMSFLIKILILTLVSYSQAINDCYCRLKTENKIVNGQFSLKNSMPWLISLAEYNYHICGGSIINRRMILTAAHCVDGKTADTLTVRVGLHNIKDEISDNKVYQVSKIISHEYHGIQVAGDIAILELSKEIELIRGEVEKACFNTIYKTYSEKLLAAGWGRTQHSYLHPETKKMTLRGIPDFLKEAFFEENKLNCPKFLICLKPIRKGDSICQGDSGGPLHYTENGITTVQGVASYVYSEIKDETTVYCTGESAYSRLSHYFKWFRETVGGNYCSRMNAVN